MMVSLGEVFRGDSDPLGRGVPFVQCYYTSHLAPYGKVCPLIWTRMPGLMTVRSHTPEEEEEEERCEKSDFCDSN